MTNNEKFNKLINDSEDPEWMLAALALLLGGTREQQTTEGGRLHEQY